MLNDEMVQQIAEEAEAADWQEHVQAALTKPTVSSLSALTTFPQRMESVKEGLGGYNPGKAASNLNDAVSVSYALNGGHTLVALKRLVQRRAGHRNSERSPSLDSQGKPIPPDRWGNSTEITDSLISHIRSRDPARLEQAKGIAGMVIALSVDPEEVPQILANSGFKDDRTAAEKKAAERRLELPSVYED